MLNNLWQYRTRNIFSITIICLSFLTLGTFLSLSNNLSHTAKTLAQKRIVVFFLDLSLEEGTQVALLRKIRESSLIKDARLVTSEEAAKRFNESFPDLEEIILNLDANPFPPSIEANLIDAPLEPATVTEFIRTYEREAGIEDVQYNRDWVERMEALSRLVRAIGLFLGGILILASFFIISNVIKLNVMARKSEVEILRLVGATNTYIRIPFFFEGITLGLLGSFTALVLVFLLIRIFPVYLGQTLGVLNDLIKFRSLTVFQSLTLLVFGAFIGCLGSLTSLSRFLKT